MVKIIKYFGLLCCLAILVFGTSLSNHVQAENHQKPKDDTPANGESEEFFQEKEIFDVDDGKGYAQYRIPSISVTSDGTVLAVAEARTGGDQTPTDLVLKRSTDGGETFSEQEILAPGVSEDNAEMNPMLITENNGETVYLLWSRWEWDNPKYFMKKSTDDGASWEETEDITYVLDEYMDAEGSEYFADLSGAGMGPGHGFQMSNGSLVVPIYLTTENWEESTVAYIYSDDDGSTWQAGPLVPNPDGFSKIHENMMVETSDGGLMTNMRNPDSSHRAISTTEGLDQEWSSPASDKELVDPVNQGSLANDNDGKIFFTNTANTAARTNMTIRMSDDDGESWRASREIYAGTTGYSDVNVGPDQTVYTLYERPAGDRVVLASFNKDWITNGPETSTNILGSMIKTIAEEGQLAEDAAQPLKKHVTAVTYYEDKQSRSKVKKHLEGLKQLLDYQFKEEEISQQVYSALEVKTEEIQEKYNE